MRVCVCVSVHLAGQYMKYAESKCCFEASIKHQMSFGQYLLITSVITKICRNKLIKLPGKIKKVVFR